VITRHDQACIKSCKTPMISSSLIPDVSINIAICCNWTAPAPLHVSLAVVKPVEPSALVRDRNDDSFAYLV
jgi:hypothetical protein